MKNIFIVLLLSLTIATNVSAEKIYVMNGTGYNTAEPALVNALTAIGHSVTVNTANITSLPAGFTTACTDPVHGFDWLCFFGDVNYSGLLTQVRAFLDAGGKVFYQYEVGCCVQSSTGVAALLNGLTGLPIAPNANNYIASPINAPVLKGWIAQNIDTCITIIGSAYKGLDSLPLNRQFRADSSLYNSLPLVSVCPNFGFYFTTNDFTGTIHNGAITGLGDINVWYNGDEPLWNNGQSPIDTSVLKFFFPVQQEDCYLFPQGCMITSTTGVDAINSSLNQISISPNPVSSVFTISGIKNPEEITITDLTGKIILNKIINPNEVIDLTGFSKDIYLLKFNSSIKKIVKL